MAYENIPAGLTYEGERTWGDEDSGYSSEPIFKDSSGRTVDYSPAVGGEDPQAENYSYRIEDEDGGFRAAPYLTPTEQTRADSYGMIDKVNPALRNDFFSLLQQATGGRYTEDQIVAAIKQSNFDRDFRNDSNAPSAVKQILTNLGADRNIISDESIAGYNDLAVSRSSEGQARAAYDEGGFMGLGGTNGFLGLGDIGDFGARALAMYGGVAGLDAAVGAAAGAEAGAGVGAEVGGLSSAFGEVTNAVSSGLTELSRATIQTLVDAGLPYNIATQAPSVVLRAVTGAITNPDNPLEGAAMGGLSALGSSVLSPAIGGLLPDGTSALTRGVVGNTVTNLGLQAIGPGEINAEGLAIGALNPYLASGFKEIGLPTNIIPTATRAVDQLITSGELNADSLATGLGGKLLADVLKSEGLPQALIGATVAAATQFVTKGYIDPVSIAIKAGTAAIDSALKPSTAATTPTVKTAELDDDGLMYAANDTGTMSDASGGIESLPLQPGAIVSSGLQYVPNADGSGLTAYGIEGVTPEDTGLIVTPGEGGGYTQEDLDALDAADRKFVQDQIDKESLELGEEATNLGGLSATGKQATTTDASTLPVVTGGDISGETVGGGTGDGGVTGDIDYPTGDGGVTGDIDYPTGDGGVTGDIDYPTVGTPPVTIDTTPVGTTLTNPSTTPTTPRTTTSTTPSAEEKAASEKKRDDVLSFLPKFNPLSSGHKIESPSLFSGISDARITPYQAAQMSMINYKDAPFTFANGGLMHLKEGGLDETPEEITKRIEKFLAAEKKDAPKELSEEDKIKEYLNKKALSDSRLEFMSPLGARMMKGRGSKSQLFSGLPQESSLNYNSIMSALISGMTPLQNTANFIPRSKIPFAAHGGQIHPDLARVLKSRNVDMAYVPGPEGRFYAKHDIRGFAVGGPGTGQSDDIPTMLSDGEYVIDADTVAALGDGSSKAGASILDKFRQEIRKHKRSASVNDIPPKAKTAMAYLKTARKGK